MNEDINKTVEDKNVKPTAILQQGGSRKTNKLKKNIQILKLKLTKKKLQKELQQELQQELYKNKNKNTNKNTKHKLKKNNKKISKHK